MKISQKLTAAVAPLHLLNHPFYQAWNKGELSNETLRTYAEQYYHHVDAFPRYISATHALGENRADRRILVENLADEEGLQGEAHPELWLRFADALGVDRDSVDQNPPQPAIQNVIATFSKNAKSSFAEGMGSLFAYEHQIPEIAETKIKGLKEHYDVNDERGLSFFKVHLEADVYHRQACAEILDRLSAEDGERAIQAAKTSAQALWDFLTEIHGNTCAA